jgi:outer membrane cobalamin receptor
MGLRHTEHDTFGTPPIPGTWATDWRSATAATVFASAGTAFRAPDATDRFRLGRQPGPGPGNLAHAWNSACAIASAPPPAAASACSIRASTISSPIPARRWKTSKRPASVALSWPCSMPPASWDAQLEASLQHPRDESRDEWLLRRARKQPHRTQCRLPHRRQGRLGAELLAVGARRDSFARQLHRHDQPRLRHPEPDWRKPGSAPSSRSGHGSKTCSTATTVWRTASARQDRSYYLTLRYQPRALIACHVDSSSP